jgi:PAS domain S-box-containing protein
MQEQHDGHGGREAMMWGASERVGWFRFFFDDERWEWSPQVAHMHGYPPESVNPTTELVLSHKHPDDYRQIADTLALIRQTRQAFSSRHRIRDVQGAVHHVVVVGDQLRNGDGSVVGTHGFYVDITPAEEARQDHLTAEVEKITKSRASIEQAKGMLMAIYGIDGDAAFDLLKWRSQETTRRADRFGLLGSRPRRGTAGPVGLRQSAVDRPRPR